MSCIYAHDDKVSDECKRDAREALLLVKADIAQANFVGQLCGSDIVAHCGDVEPGDGRIQACLAEKRGDFSQTCREALDNLSRSPTPRRLRSASSRPPAREGAAA